MCVSKDELPRRGNIGAQAQHIGGMEGRPVWLEQDGAWGNEVCVVGVVSHRAFEAFSLREWGATAGWQRSATVGLRSFQAT